jgi:transitional endoplasmic reticulum ATPase
LIERSSFSSKILGLSSFFTPFSTHNPINPKYAIEADMEKRRAAEAEGREYVEDDDEYDEVPEITKTHFEMAMSEARRSVSDADLLKYGPLQRRAILGGGQTSFRFPGQGGGIGGSGGANMDMDDDDDDNLYA